MTGQIALLPQMSILLHYLTKYNISNTSPLCRMFQAAAYDVWERMAFSRTRPRMKIHETSITQNLVYELNLIKWKYSLSGLSIYESTNEAAHGDDLEICIVQRNGQVYKYALQSKILYHNLRSRNAIRLDDGDYKKLKHSVSGSNQIDLLIQYASSVGAMPLYLLYNYVSGHSFTGSACNVGYDTGQYGCTLVPANYLKVHHSDSNGNLKDNVKFSELHPDYAIPWFLLACCFPDFTTIQTLQAFALPPNSVNLQPYNVDDIETDNRRWNILGPISEIKTNIVNDYKQAVEGFQFKFRIFINVRAELRT